MTAPKNLLIVHAHDMGRYNSAYGHDIPTPRMRRLAEEGTTFRQAFCAAPTCSPSRAAMLTGLTAHETGMLGLAHRGFELNDYSRHLARRLSRQGFHTVRAGMQHEYRGGDAHWGESDQGEMYDEVVEVESPEKHRDLQTADAAADFLARDPGDSPWFLWMGLFYPHREFLEPDPVRHNPDRMKVPDPLPDTVEVRRDMAGYHASVEVADQALGRVLDALQASGRAEDTLVVLTTDHGIAFPHMKCNLTHHGTGITWIMRHPGTVQAGKSRDALVSHLDLVPTVMACLGAEPPRDGHGVSLRPLLEGRGQAPREDAFAEVNVHAGIEPKRSVRTRRFNYIRIFESDLSPVLPNIDNSPSKDLWVAHGYAERNRDRVQLYDLVLDPQERHNVAEDAAYAGALKEMEERLEAWMRKTDDPLMEGPLVVPAGSKITPRGAFAPREDLTELPDDLRVE